MLPLYALVRPPTAPPPGGGRLPVLVLLHGVGGNETNLFPLADRLAPHATVVAARGPITLGPDRYAWFHVDFTASGPVINADEAEDSRIALATFALRARAEFDADRVVFAGFSQGGILAASVALTRPDAVDAAAVLSGRILPEIEPRIAGAEALAGLPILVTHGRADAVLPLHHAVASRERLAALPVALTYRELDGGHEVSDDAVDALRAWLDADAFTAAVPASLRGGTSRRRFLQVGAAAAPALALASIVPFAGASPAASPTHMDLRLSDQAALTLGHTHLKVRDVDRSVDFYQRVFGLSVSERVGNAYAFLTGSAMHHTIALQGVGPDAPAAARGAVGLYHVAFEVPDKAAFARSYVALADAGIGPVAVDHGISYALYFSDPDGNGLEIYADTRSEPHGQPQWQGLSDPLDDRDLRALASESAAAHAQTAPALV